MIGLVEKSQFFPRTNFNDVKHSLTEMTRLTFLNTDNVDWRIIATHLLKKMGKCRFLIGKHLAIPHLRSSLVEKPYLSLFTIPNGIIADPTIGCKSKFCWLMIFPDAWDDTFLRFVGKLEYLFRFDSFRDELYWAKDGKIMSTCIIKQYLKHEEYFENHNLLKSNQSPSDLSVRVVIQHSIGIHARPALTMVASYDKWVKERNPHNNKSFFLKYKDDDFRYPADSIMGVMSFGAACGLEFEIHGKNCTMMDFEFYLAGFGAWELSEGVWATDFFLGW